MFEELHIATTKLLAGFFGDFDRALHVCFSVDLRNTDFAVAEDAGSCFRSGYAEAAQRHRTRFYYLTITLISPGQKKGALHYPWLDFRDPGCQTNRHRATLGAKVNLDILPAINKECLACQPPSNFLVKQRYLFGAPFVILRQRNYLTSNLPCLVSICLSS
jgi:hypothetical protein